MRSLKKYQNCKKKFPSLKRNKVKNQKGRYKLVFISKNYKNTPKRQIKYKRFFKVSK